ncbi:MAG: FAD:protein FMN transferase [Candidatus Polarisedimenticolia bacterium]
MSFALTLLLSMTPVAADVSRARYLMGTVCEVTAPSLSGDDAGRARTAAALEAALEEIARLERILSDWRPDSEMSRLNRQPAGAPFTCSLDLFDFLSVGERLSAATGGAFDMTVGPLVKLYDLRGAGRWAGASEVAATLKSVGSRHLRLDGASRSVTLGAAGMALDPGALGKGYALDAAARTLRARGVDRALLNFGGQVLALGAPEGKDGWEVALSHPRRRHEAVMTLVLRDASLSTSANVELGKVVDGRDLGHVVDPGTGLPVSWRGSATVVAGTAADADALSTALLVMGLERGLAWADRHEGLTAIFLDEDERGQLNVRTGPGLEKLHATPLPTTADGAAESGGS